MRERLIPNDCLPSVYDITPQYLKDRNISGLILDIDNTLTTYSCRSAEEHTLTWLKTLQDAGFRLCILSNGGPERVTQYNEKLALPFRYRSMKPKRAGFLWAAKTLDLPPEKIAVVGDQLFTDVAGGNSAGMYTILTTPFAEDEMWLVRAKRVIEKPILRRIHSKNKEK